MKYDDDAVRALNELPANPEAIRNSAETVGRTIGQKVKEAGIRTEEVMNSFQTGLKDGFEHWTGDSPTGQTSER